MSDELFKMPKPVITQQGRCRACADGLYSGDFGHCNKFDLAIEYHDGNAYHVNGGQQFTCNGRKYTDCTD